MVKKFGFFLGVCNLLITLSLIRFVSDQISVANLGSQFHLQNRFARMLDHVSDMTKDPRSTTLLLGTSIFAYFFDPVPFDDSLSKRGLRSKTFNLAFEGMIGPGLYSLANRLESEFADHDRFRSVVIELSPACLNQRFYNNHRFMLDVQNPSLFLNLSAWKDMFINDAPNTAYVAINQALRPFDWTDLLPVANFFGDRRRSSKIVWPGMAALWRKDIFRENPAWNINNAGLANWNLPASASFFNEEIDKIHQLENWQRMIQMYRNGNGVNETFAFDGRLIQSYVESVKVARRFADHIYLVVMPYAPAFRKHVDKYVDTKWLIKKIADETKVPIFNLSDTLALTDADFADAMHPLHGTMVQLATVLGQRVADDLEKHGQVTASQ